LTFGALLFMLPASMFDPGAGSVLGAAAMYKVVGLAIAIVAPLLYTVSRY
jgi:hypothetical protein